MVHVISRFCNGEFRLADDGARNAYLKRASVAFAKSDWRALSYALMSSHVHWAFLSGRAPLSRIFQSLNTSTGLWLNKRQARSGPVFAQRPTAIVVRGANCAALLAYIHNNPVRAGVVDCANASSWTSHQFFAEGAHPPAWLRVDLALCVGGFAANNEGRASFARFVRQRASDSRFTNSEKKELELRRRLRLSVGTAVEPGTHELDLASHTVHSAPILSAAPVLLHVKWNGSVHDAVAQVALSRGLPYSSMSSSTRLRRVTSARRLALLVWTRFLRRPANQMAAALQISTAAASDLLKDPHAVEALAGEAVLLADKLRALRPSEQRNNLET